MTLLINVFFFGLILALSALVIEAVLRRHQGNISVGFHNDVYLAYYSRFEDAPFKTMETPRIRITVTN